MSWLYEKRRLPSAKNGELVCVRKFGVWSITVNGYFQTAPYMTALWEKSIRRVPKSAPIKRVLLLGLGAGGNVRTVLKRYPKAKIVALEWDDEMVKLAQELGLYKKEETPEIVFGDAGETIKKLSGTFDLVLFDLYRGKQTSPLAWDEDFLKELQRLMEPDAYLLFNVFAKREALDVISNYFSRWQRFTYKYNTCALFRPFGCGNAGDPILPGFQPYHAVADVLRLDLQAPHVKDQFIETRNGCFGRRWGHGPLRFEGYYGDVEPGVAVGEGKRLVIWQPLSRMDVPKGWHRSLMMMNTRKTGYAPVVEAYWKSWSSHAQRHRKEWLKQTTFTLVPVSGPEFLAAYENAKIEWLLKKLFVWLLKRKIAAFGELVHGWVAKDSAGKIVAGLFVQDIPSAKSALHVSAFYEKSVARTPVNYGLIDQWFRDALAKGFAFLDFDIFWTKGDPREWKGFSKFKAQFGTRFIRYPNPLVKLAK